MKKYSPVCVDISDWGFRIAVLAHLPLAKLSADELQRKTSVTQDSELAGLISTQMKVELHLAHSALLCASHY